MIKSYWIPIALAIIVFGCLYYWVINFSYVQSDEDRLLEEINHLTVKVDSIRGANDSIKIIIDTTEVKIEHVYEKYIQVYDRIITQSVDSDCVFFSRYLSEDSKRFIDTINFKSIETY
jgi:hypothetical protein